jgi:hypothetical protein
MFIFQNAAISVTSTLYQRSPDFPTVFPMLKKIVDTPGMGGGEIKENDGGGEFTYDIFDIL